MTETVGMVVVGITMSVGTMSIGSFEMLTVFAGGV